MWNQQPPGNADAANELKLHSDARADGIPQVDGSRLCLLTLYRHVGRLQGYHKVRARRAGHRLLAQCGWRHIAHHSAEPPCALPTHQVTAANARDDVAAAMCLPSGAFLRQHAPIQAFFVPQLVAHHTPKRQRLMRQPAPAVKHFRINVPPPPAALPLPGQLCRALLTGTPKQMAWGSERTAAGVQRPATWPALG